MRLRPHPSVAHLRSMLANLADRTGRTIDEWSEEVSALGETEVNAAAAALKAKFDLGKPTAWLIASHALKENMADYDEAAYLARAPQLVDEQFAGKKAALRPIADEVIKLAEVCGEDVAVSPCKTYIPLYRNHVFAQVKAATQKRVDVGLALKGYDGDIPDALIDTGGAAKGDRITHAIRINAGDTVDDGVGVWLKRAYELDA